MDVRTWFNFTDCELFFLVRGAPTLLRPSALDFDRSNADLAFLLVSAVALVASACGGQVCSPGETQTCVCSGGAQGAQVCKSDGSGWEACDCGGGGQDAGVDGMTDDTCGGGSCPGDQQPNLCGGCKSPSNAPKSTTDDGAGSAVPTTTKDQSKSESSQQESDELNVFAVD